MTPEDAYYVFSIVMIVVAMGIGFALGRRSVQH